MFNSTLKLDVYAEIDRDGFTKYELLGKTPSAKPIAIPHGAKWSVSPNNAAINDVGLRAICKEIGDQDIPGLKLYHCRYITDAGLAHLKGLTKLEQLNVRDCDKLTDAGLAHLKGLTKLERLNISWCDNITGAGLVHLKGLTKLERLDITDSRKLTGVGLAHLKGLPKLKQLSLSQCDKITKEGIAELKKALPNTTIKHSASR
jgi:hypothetical protein